MNAVAWSITTRAAPMTDLIRSVALRLFVEKGFQSVSLRTIADEVGIQPGSLYNHMESKQALLLEFVEELEFGLLHAVTQGSGRDKADVALDRYVDRYVRFSLAHRELHTLARRETCCLEREQRQVVQRLRGQQIRYLERILALGQAQGCFAVEDVSTVVRAVLAVLDGCVEEGHRGDVDALVGRLQTLIRKCLAL